MENFQITEFLSPSNMNITTQLIISGLFVMCIVQAFKGFVDGITKKILKRKLKTKNFTLFVCVLQVIFVMFAVNKDSFNVVSFWTMVINIALLFLSCTSGFDFIFKKITVRTEEKANEIK